MLAREDNDGRGCYGLTKAALARRAALLSTLLFAVRPWAVLYARKIPRMLPLFTPALMASLDLAPARHRVLVQASASLAALLGLVLLLVATR